MSEVNILEYLQKLSHPVTDTIMIGVSYLGTEMLFMVAAVLLYWCFDKKFAYKFMNVYLLGVSVNEGLKNIIRRPRPFAGNPDHIRSIGARTSGFSMPSGHSQSLANITVQLSKQYRGKRAGDVLLPLGVYLTIAVMFSRMFLGQHYLSDVLVGCAVGVGSAFLFSYLFDLLGDREEWIFVVVLPLTVLVAVILACTGVAQNAADIMKALGGYGAVTIAYFLEKRYVRYEVRADRIWKYFLRVILGLAVTLGLKEGLKYAFPKDVAILYGYLRYLLVALWAGLGAPALFKLLKI